VVNLAISEALHGRRPDDDEGILSARRAAIVSTSGLARLARRISLGDFLLLGEGEAQRGGRARPILLASGLEAVAAALFLDQGWEAARAWLCALAAPELAADAPPGLLKSPKSRLQELTQRSSGERPDYRLTEVSGPDHEKRFAVEVAVGGRIAGTGSGGSRRSAETAAAAAALETLAAEQRDLPVGADPPASPAL
jgi:ribonuclease-3